MQNIFLTGIWIKPKKIVVTKGTILLAIRFKLISSTYIFNGAVKTLLETLTTLPLNYWNSNFLSNVDFSEFSDISIEIIKEKIKRTKIDSLKLFKLFDLIYGKKIFVIGEISQILNWSPRQINRTFNTNFGFPLKTFIMIVRCQDSYLDIAKGKLYPSAKYTDQSHFIRDIKKFTGATPKELNKNDNDRFIQLTPLKKIIIK